MLLTLESASRQREPFQFGDAETIRKASPEAQELIERLAAIAAGRWEEKYTILAEAVDRLCDAVKYEGGDVIDLLTDAEDRFAFPHKADDESPLHLQTACQKARGPIREIIKEANEARAMLTAIQENRMELVTGVA